MERAMGQAVSSFSRIFLGWLSSHYYSQRIMLACLGIAMGAACVATGLLQPGWTIVVAIAYSCTAGSFHGVLISEIVRLAPSKQIGRITGGLFAFANAGFTIYPAFFGFIFQVTGSYRFGFTVGALPALLVGILFFHRR